MVAPPSTPPYWPGGIPREVQLDANGDIPRQQTFEEAKGWFLFLTRFLRSDGALVQQEMYPRRMEITKFANDENLWWHGQQPAKNSVSYTTSARSRGTHWNTLKVLWTIAGIPATLFIYYGELGHCLEHWGLNHGGIDPNPATFPDPSTVQITDVLPRAIPEIADFRCMVMTRRGTVLFMDRLKPCFLVTAEDLNTGHITMVEFKRNGQVQASLRRRAYNFFAVYQHYSVDWKSLKAIEEDWVGGNWNHNGDVDMTLPIIDIMEGARERDEFLWGFHGGRDGWAEDIELYAPGYLEMEAVGAEANYLIDPGRAYDIRRRMYEEELSRS